MSALTSNLWPYSPTISNCLNWLVLIPLFSEGEKRISCSYVHSNAFFFGFLKTKTILLFDTLLGIEGAPGIYLQLPELAILDSSKPRPILGRRNATFALYVHSNAYFFGFLKTKTIVLFDTLLGMEGAEEKSEEHTGSTGEKHEKCTDDEIVAGK